VKCFLHIGSAKTGTTALQDILHSNRDLLAQRGRIYPQSCLWRGDRSHNTLGIFFWDGFLEKFKVESFSEVLGKLLAEISGAPEVIISSELIEKAVTHGNEMLTTFLVAIAQAGYEIHVVYVVRRQDFYLDSQFKQAVGDHLTAYAGTAEDFIEHEARGLNYASTAAAWQSRPEVSTVTVIPYVEGRADLTVLRVLTRIGCADLLDRNVATPTANLSLDGDFLRLKHYLNRFPLPPHIDQRFRTAFKASQGMNPRLTLFSPGDRSTLLQRFSEDHLRLTSHFGLDLKAWNEPPPVVQELFTPLAPPDLRPIMSRVQEVDPVLRDEISAVLT